MTQLERELLRIYVEAEDYTDFDSHQAAFDWLVGKDRVVLDMLWRLCLVEP